uniref:Si:ch211-166a6.5 n=1 Tax=Lepisosteus oculatus TaxID=7918 RepID=W5MQ76_LEPOC
MKETAARDTVLGVPVQSNGSPALHTTGRNTGEAGLEDAPFTVKIQGAGIEPFELQVGQCWLVQDLAQAVLAREEVVPRTCLALSLHGVTLEPLSELGAAKGFGLGVTIKLIEELYSPQAVRVHLARLQELLQSPGPQDALRQGQSPTYLDAASQGTVPEVSPGRGSRRSASDARVDPPADCPPPDFILPGCRERPLLSLIPALPASTHSENSACLSDLSLSRWNPPPRNRKLQGDLLYLTVCTLEGKRCDITSCPKGFYLNQSTEAQFDPRPATPSLLSHSLADLLAQLSPRFKKGLTALRSRSQRPLLETMATPYRTLAWVAPLLQHRPTCDPYSWRLGLEEHSSGQAPDWNEELQAARDLPQSTLEERLLRSRALLQVSSGFVWAVTQGAEAVIDGSAVPINPSEEPQLQAFLCGGVFFSQGAEGGVLGGKRGARAAPRLELAGVQAYSQLGKGLVGQGALHTLPAAVVDYRGVRLAAQGLAPGWLEPEQEGQGAAGSTRLLYGLSAPPQEGGPRRRLLELLAQAAKSLAIQKHSVLTPRDHPAPLFSSADCRGVLGADGRYYVTDLFRTLPPDVNFLPQERKGEDGWPSGYSSLSLPRVFPHQLCRLRPELVSAFIQHKSSQFKQRVKETMAQSGPDHGEEGEREMGARNGSVHLLSISGSGQGVDAIRAACKELGSVSDIIFEIRFNPDLYSPGVRFPEEEQGAVQLQERLLREAAAFLVTEQIPAFVSDCRHRHVIPADGATLAQALHQRGINLRYMGQVVRTIDQSQHTERLTHVKRLLYGEMIVRSARRVLNNSLQGVETSSLAAAVSHFLCCLLGPHCNPAPVGEEPKRRSRRRGRGGGGVSDNTGWSVLSAAELWNLISLDVQETYDLKTDLGSSIDHVVEVYGLQKVSVLRELCLKMGIQVQLKEYNLDSRHRPPFSPEDILGIFPVVKHLTTGSRDATRVFLGAQASVQKGQLLEGYEQLKEAVYLFSRTCDELHPDACACLSALARVAHVLGRSAEARSVQLRAVVVSERVLGFDHPNTVQEYALLAVYVCTGGELPLARRLLYRARLLLLLLHGEDHPYMATLDSSIGLLLQGEQSVQFLQSALRINTKFCGSDDPQTALSHHLLAQALCSVGEYRSAMSQEKAALVVYQAQFGEDHQQTKASLNFLQAITQQAVRVERTLRQGADPVEAAPPQILTPSLETRLEQLALVNGI